MTPPGRTTSAVRVLILLTAAVAAVIIFQALPWGPWAGSDSVAYIEAARNLANGRGLVTVQPSGEIQPLSLRPPLYSILLGGMAKLGVGFFQAARCADAGLMAVLIVAVGWAALASMRDPAIALTLGLGLATSSVLINAYTGVMTEPLALTLGSLCLLLAIGSSQRGSSNRLAASAILGALALLARYSGIVFPVVGLITILAFTRTSLRRRLGAAAIYALVSLGPFAAWSLAIGRRNATVGEFQLPQQGLWEATRPLRAAAATIPWNWLPFSEALGPVSYPIRLAALAGVCAMVLVLIALGLVRIRRSRAPSASRSPAFQLAAVFALLSALSAAFVGATYLLVEYPKPALDDRILSPVYLGAMIAVLAALHFSLGALGWRRAAWIVPSTVAILSVLSNLTATTSLLRELHDDGRGYTARTWHFPGILEDVAAIPASVPLISNDVDAIMLYLDRPAYRIPELEGRQFPDSFTTFGQVPEDGVQRLFREQGAALVLFSSIRGQFIELYGDGADDRLRAFSDGLEVAADRWDGVIYYYPESGPPD